LLDPHRATPQPVSPANGKSFKLAELYAMLDCRTVDVVRLSPELILIIDDEGKSATTSNSANQSGAGSGWPRLSPRFRMKTKLFQAYGYEKESLSTVAVRLTERAVSLAKAKALFRKYYVLTSPVTETT